MRILFVVPNIKGRVGSPPINVSLLNSFINNKSNHVGNIADLTFHKKRWKKYLAEIITKNEYDLVGISILSFDYNPALEIAEFLKLNYDIKIIFGGVHAILKPDDVIMNKNVDMVCTGEGEYVLKELLDRELKCNGVEGIWYKDNGKVIKNCARKIEENLDIFPFPDWNEYELEKYFIVNNNHLTLMASRGCPYKCTYCNNNALKQRLGGNYVRFRSVDNVLDEVEVVKDRYMSRGCKHIYFIDDIFILNKKWVFEFCDKYVERGYDKYFSWMVNVRANLVTEEIIEALKSAGCYQVGMGIEAASDFVRNKIYKRNISKEQIEKAVRIINDSGLLLSTQFIIGAPYENIEMMEKSLKMAKRINADTIMFSLLMPLPKTEIRELCEKNNLIKKDIKNSQEMYSCPLIKSELVTSKQLKAFYRKVRHYQIRKYIFDGIRLKKAKFFLDLVLFFVYYMPKYNLEIQNAFKFTVKKYQIESIH